jgi:transcriptional regulator with XRE-family HTH domain
MTDLQKALIKTTLSVEAIAREFQVSRPTVKRWIAGEAEPHEKLTKHILKFLDQFDEIQAIISSESRSDDTSGGNGLGW